MSSISCEFEKLPKKKASQTTNQKTIEKEKAKARSEARKGKNFTRYTQ